MKKIPLAIFVLALSSCELSAQTTNCTADEQIIFSCTSGKKLVSVCSAPKNATKNYIEYRFTSDKKSNLTYRADKDSLTHQFNRSTLTGASSASTVLWFQNQGYLYAMSDPVKGIPSLIVQKAKKEISNMACSENMKIDLETKNPLIKELTSDDYFKLFN